MKDTGFHIICIPRVQLFGSHPRIADWLLLTNGRHRIPRKATTHSRKHDASGGSEAEAPMPWAQSASLCRQRRRRSDRGRRTQGAALFLCAFWLFSAAKHFAPSVARGAAGTADLREKTDTEVVTSEENNLYYD